jgi:hypothetical protein
LVLLPTDLEGYFLTNGPRINKIITGRHKASSVMDFDNVTLSGVSNILFLARLSL